MMHPLKGRVFFDCHPERRDRMLAVIWEGSKNVIVFSDRKRTTKIKKSRLCNPVRYRDIGYAIDPNEDFVSRNFPRIRNKYNV
jgi:hypothetical protein